ncbi:hypothetical protein D3C85_1454260 [compost metagenome]
MTFIRNDNRLACQVDQPVDPRAGFSVQVALMHRPVTKLVILALLFQAFGGIPVYLGVSEQQAAGVLRELASIDVHVVHFL